MLRVCSARSADSRARTADARVACRQVPTADSALSSATALQRDAMRLALDDFVAALKQQAAVPSAPAWGGSTAESLSPVAGYTPNPSKHRSPLLLTHSPL